MASCGTSSHEMKNDQLDAEIKTRVPRDQKEQLQRHAQAEHLKPSDIFRKAVREYLERHGVRSKSAKAA